MNTDGSIVRYIQLAHNRRVGRGDPGGGARQSWSRGRLGREGMRRLVASINRYLDDTDDLDGGEDVSVEFGDAFTGIGSRPMDTAWLFDGLWSQFGVASALAKVLGHRPFTVDQPGLRAIRSQGVVLRVGLATGERLTDVERVLFALVGDRAIDPVSKLVAAEECIPKLPASSRKEPAACRQIQ